MAVTFPATNPDPGAGNGGDVVGPWLPGPEATVAGGLAGAGSAPDVGAVLGGIEVVVDEDVVDEGVVDEDVVDEEVELDSGASVPLAVALTGRWCVLRVPGAAVLGPAPHALAPMASATPTLANTKLGARRRRRWVTAMPDHLARASRAVGRAMGGWERRPRCR